MATARTNTYRLEIEKIKNEGDFRELLFFLLQKMEFKNIEITHGPNEEGKDLVFSKDNAFGEKDWFSMVVKIGNITGSASGKGNTVKNVRHQIELCFEQPYYYAKENKQVYMNKVVVVANGAISQPAERQLVEKLTEKANVSFWTVSSLSELVERHLPDYFIDIDLFVSEYYNALIQEFERMNELRSLKYNKELKKLFDVFIEPTLILTKQNPVKSKDSPHPPTSFEKRKANSLLDSSENVLIVGEPGSGKSTLFRELILENIDRCKNNKEFVIMPVFVRFKDVIEKGTVKSAVQSAIDFFNPSGHEYNLESKLSLGHICVYLDALDEIPDDSKIQIALDRVATFSQAYKRVRIIASSRNIDFVKQRDQIANFIKMEVLPLNYAQMRSFMAKWFSKNEAKKKLLLESLRDTEIMNKLPKTPLVVTLIAILFDENEREIPSNLTELYSMFTELLLGRWDTERQVESHYGYEFKDRILRLLAITLQERRVDEITSEDLKSFVQQYFAERGIEENTDEFIIEIEKRSQLLFRNPRDNFQFKHLSFQEFFASKELFETHAPKDFIVTRFLDLWWQNVIFFYCGRMKECPDEIKAIIEKVPFETFVQAAFASKTSDKSRAIEHALSVLAVCYSGILGQQNGPLKVLKKASRFFLIEILGLIFELYYSSVTLKASLKQTFEEIKKNLETANVEDKNRMVMDLYFVANALSEIGDNGEMIELADTISSSDLSLAYAIQLRLEAYKDGSSSQKFKKALRHVKRRTSKWRKELVRELKTPAGLLDSKKAD